MVQQAFESHLIVKEMLVDAVLQQATVELETRYERDLVDSGKVLEVFATVEKELESARQRCA